MKSKSLINVVVKMLLIILLSIIVGFLLLLGVYSIPTDRAFNNAKRSYDVYAADKIETWTGNPRYARVDNGTDRLMIAESICRPFDSIVDNALLNPHFYYGETDSGALMYALDGEDVSYTTYGRYWHGYLTYIIPGLFFFSTGELRIVFMIVEFILAIMLILELDKYKRIYVYIFGIIALLINPITAAINFQIADIYILMMVFSIIVLKYNDWLLQKNRYLFLFLLNGIAVAYFDYLTYPLVAWGIPMVLALLINNYEIEKAISQVIICSIMWCLGYAGMWFGKWVLATLLTDVNVIEDGINKFFLDSMNSDTTNFDLSYANTLFRVRETFDTPMTALLLLGFVVIAIDVIVNKKNIVINKKYILETIPLLIIALAPFVWYYVVRYHSCSHIYMEYRQIVITIFVIYMCIEKAFV